jgi:hypothetical protein
MQERQHSVMPEGSFIEVAATARESDGRVVLQFADETGALAVDRGDVQVEEGRVRLRVGSPCEIVRPPARTIPPTEAEGTTYACVGYNPAVPNIPGALIDCSTGQVVGQCVFLSTC